MAHLDVNARKFEDIYTPMYLKLHCLQIIKDNGYLSGFPSVGGRGSAPEYFGEFYFGHFSKKFRWGVVSTSYHGKHELTVLYERLHIHVDLCL